MLQKKYFKIFTHFKKQYKNEKERRSMNLFPLRGSKSDIKRVLGNLLRQLDFLFVFRRNHSSLAASNFH